ncbi:hypothetical protein J6590_008882 [Homalodisca vitripennis]|nr:hypothetical protein J6590_008882 [Homalodisca vitripennis]
MSMSGTSQIVHFEIQGCKGNQFSSSLLQMIAGLPRNKGVQHLLALTGEAGTELAFQGDFTETNDQNSTSWISTGGGLYPQSYPSRTSYQSGSSANVLLNQERERRGVATLTSRRLVLQGTTNPVPIRQIRFDPPTLQPVFQPDRGREMRNSVLCQLSRSADLCLSFVVDYCLNFTMDEDLADFLLLDRNLLLNSNTRQFWVHEFNEDHTQSEFYVTCLPLRDHADKFKKYYRMTVETYDYILSHIKGDLQKWSNFRTCIEPAEKLSILLR